MSETKLTVGAARANLRYMISDYLPDAHIVLEAAFRFDNSLFKLQQMLVLYGAPRGVDHVSGVPPCRWSLDWFVQRRPLPLSSVRETVGRFVKAQVGITMVFDNPFITDDMLTDTYGMLLVQELERVREHGRVALCVASDKLAEYLSARFPHIPMICHYNRFVVEPGRRTPKLYETIGKRYNRTMLHPNDAVRPAIFRALAEPQRYDVVLNDFCLRTCPVRREHLRLLAHMREQPYNADLLVQRQELLQRAGCEGCQAPDLGRNERAILTRQEAKALYDAGFRAFVVQGHQFRNELTLLWDFFRCAYDWQPTLANKTSLVATSAMGELSRRPPQLPGGCRDFQFSQYE